MNHVLQIHDFLSTEECDRILDKYKTQTVDDKAYEHTGYQYCIMNCADDVDWIIKSKEGKAIKMYLDAFPEAEWTPHAWRLEELLFKHWKPGSYFHNWHSENCLQHPYRVLNFQIYLSDHNCGTQFFNEQVIKSDKGKMVMFPAYFTHTHRGQACPHNKDRYMLGGYFHYFDKRLMW
ncbi:putative prolyl 4-hydroxylase [uncultured virus]|uniref:Putative prolyl 4-hydroxylase n=1 Tax=uncultured virus TaxID=340016 RepID=A0A218MKH4_9VIRU|nr:putative prolyl 4-hydroxylase [uncultured virus]